MPEIRIPAELLPLDGRFGCGPSLVRPAQVDHLVAHSVNVLGTSHRQPPVKEMVGRIRSGIASLFRAPDGYEVVLANGGATGFWDAAAYGLVERRAQNAVFGEFGSKFASAVTTPSLEAPDVREAPAGSIAVPEPVEGVDVYAWPHNETSPGAKAPVGRVAGDTGAHTVLAPPSPAGLAPARDPNRHDPTFTSPGA